jgi:hypothetical protein
MFAQGMHTTIVDDPPETSPMTDRLSPPPPDATVKMASVPVTAPMPMRTTPLPQRAAKIAPTAPMFDVMADPGGERLTYEIITADDTLKERATLVDPPRMTPLKRALFIGGICFVFFGTIGLAIGSCEERQVIEGAGLVVNATTTVTATSIPPATVTAPATPPPPLPRGPKSKHR